MALKSADHIEAILALINVGTWASDHIWAYHKGDQDYDEVPRPASVRNMGGGLIAITAAGTQLVPNGKPMYASEADFWKKALTHWPRPGKIRKSHWTREYRRKVGTELVRKFDLFVQPIYALTYEENNEITKIQFYGRNLHLPSPARDIDTLLHEWTK